MARTRRRFSAALKARVALEAIRGPAPDMPDLPQLLAGLPPGVVVLKLLLDAGFDSEANHCYLRDEHGIRSVIPARIGRPTAQPPQGYWRRQMRRQLRSKRRRRRCGYTQRVQVETVNSMLKRNLGDALWSKSYHAQSREMRLLLITHNIMILIVFVEVFDRARFRQFWPIRGNLVSHTIFPVFRSIANR